MSARLTSEELKRISPAEYEKQYGDQDAELSRLAEIRAETDRLNAETRLLEARRRNERAKSPPPAKSRRSPRSEGYYIAYAIITLFVFFAHIAAAIYILSQ